MVLNKVDFVPIQFNVFIDELLFKFEDLQGAMWAMTPSLEALRIMLSCGTRFAANNNVLFNSVKSHCLNFK